MLFSSFLGGAVEFYDFLLDGTAAALVFGQLFFSDLTPVVAPGIPITPGPPRPRRFSFSEDRCGFEHNRKYVTNRDDPNRGDSVADGQMTNPRVEHQPSRLRD